MEVTTKDLRLHTAEVLAAADRGEAVLVRFRGKPRAVLTRWTADDAPKRGTGHNPAFGLWADQAGDVAEQVRRMRAGRSFA